MSESQSVGRDAAQHPGAQPAGPPVREAFVAIDHDDVGDSADLVALGQDAGLRYLDLLATHERRVVVQLEVDDRVDETRLTALPAVEEYDHIRAGDGPHLYIVELALPTFPTILADRRTELVAYDQDLTADGIRMSLVGPQAAIADLVETYDDAGLSPDVEKLGAFDGRERPLDALTDRQREVLRTAFEMGYYAVPREASAADLATELDLDVSTVTEHLQRAERNLLGAVLERSP